jgi:hypothetical protein
VKFLFVLEEEQGEHNRKIEDKYEIKGTLWVVVGER